MASIRRVPAKRISIDCSDDRNEARRTDPDLAERVAGKLSR